MEIIQTTETEGLLVLFNSAAVPSVHALVLKVRTFLNYFLIIFTQGSKYFT